MSREDRNTAIIVILVLVVCTISLVAILNALWRLISPGVNALVSVVGLNVQRITIDYNFTVPARPTSSPAPVEYNYNFVVPAKQPILVNPQLIHYADNVADTTYAGSDTSQINKIITIPKLNIDTPVFIGSDPRTSLTIGWWSDPRSHWMEHGEILVYCHRRYFAPSDQRSCWHLDQLEIGDEIYFGTGETRQLYKVIGKNIFAATDSTPQQISETEDYLKIVTTEPLLQNDKRLVILAKLQE